MHPLVRRDLPPLRQLYHVHWRRVAALTARSAFEGRFQLPERRIARAVDCVEWKACSRLTSIALNLKPAEAAVKALADCWGGLRRAAIAFHPERPCVGFGAVRLPGRLVSRFAGMPSMYLRAHDLAAPDDFSGLGAHGSYYNAPCEGRQSH